MKKNKKLIIGIFITITIIVAFATIIVLNKNNKQQEKNINTTDEYYDKMKNESEMYKETANVESLKNEYKLNGDDDIYEISEEMDGRKTLVVKSNLNFKVAFSGMIKKSIPEKEEIEKIYEKSFPLNNGIYVDNKDREKIKEYLNNNSKLKNHYEINENGFLEIKEEKNKTKEDEKIEKILKSDKTYILSINGTCYMIDPVTGKIVDNPYADMNQEQTYEYFIDENKIILFMTDSQRVNKDEIFESVLELLTTV